MCEADNAAYDRQAIGVEEVFLVLASFCVNVNTTDVPHNRCDGTVRFCVFRTVSPSMSSNHHICQEVAWA